MFGVPSGGGPSVGPRRRTLRSARRVKPGRRPAGHWGRRPGVAGKRERRKGRVGGRARPGGGPGARSRTVTNGTLARAAGRRGRLASRPGPQASTRTSSRQVRSVPPQAGTDLIPGPEPRVIRPGAYPARTRGRPRGRAGHREGSTVARARAARAAVALALRAPPGSLMRACLPPAHGATRRICHRPDWPRVPPLCPRTAEIGFSGFLSRSAGKSARTRSPHARSEPGILRTGAALPVTLGSRHNSMVTDRQPSLA